MRRFVVAGLALLLILGTGQSETRQADAVTRLVHLRTAGATSANPLYGFRSTDNEGDWRSERCRFRWLDGRRGFSDWEVKKTIRCAVQHWSVPGGAEGALCIAVKESGLNEWADNPYSTAAGVYQFVASTWESVKAIFEMPWWKLRESVYNARSNIVRAIRKAHAGWSWWPTWRVAPLCGLA